MADLQVARVHANVDGLAHGSYVRIDPERWKDHLRQGFLTLVPNEELERLFPTVETREIEPPAQVIE